MKCLDAKTRPYNAQTRSLILSGRLAAAAVVTLALLSGCDGGISPPDDDRVGTIAGSITYSLPWPPADEFQEIRFVALRFVPQDTADFLQLNRIEFSDPLTYGVERDSFLISNVEVGFFPYSGVARQATEDIFSWGPVGLYTGNDGVFDVSEGETTFVDIVVDFNAPPVFPEPFARPESSFPAGHVQ